jgi:hypothetical protein
MRGRWSVDEIVKSLEARAAFHRQRQSYHAGHEALHQKERLRHTAELDAITERLEAFRAAAAAAIEVAAQMPEGTARPEQPTIADQDFGSASNPRLTRMVRNVLADLGSQEPFGPQGVLEAVQRRFGEGLRTRPEPRQISGILHRLARTGEIHRLRGGRPHHESRYVREKPPA